jgi:CubicO group peptidase (beta-lactamase class C family)/D-alanyl-D-alanine dipeptidase
MKSMHALIVYLSLTSIVLADSKYRPVQERLESEVAYHLNSKNIPAITIALIDDQNTIWTNQHPTRDPILIGNVNADTIYRVGSISKTFTALAVMQAVERGALSLDEPISKYVPEFKPAGGETITLRQVLAHRAGLVRETPVGSYADRSNPSLRDGVLSLNAIKLLHEPGKVTNYSNAGYALAGRALEIATGQRFADLMREQVFKPLNMQHSSFQFADVQNRKHFLVPGKMWTAFEKESPAPLFDLAKAPAGNMYSSANDLAKFISWMFRGDDQTLSQKSLTEMMKVQFPTTAGRSQFGLGLIQTDIDGQRCVGYGGLAYGYGSQFWMLPEHKLGVVVLIAKDFTQGLADDLAQNALRQMLAAKQGKPVPQTARREPIPSDIGQAWAGRYSVIHPVNADIELEWTGSRLRMWVLRGGVPMDLALVNNEFVTDSCVNIGTRVQRMGDDRLMIGDRVFRRRPEKKPEPVADKWARYIGEYGWDHLKVMIFERERSLYAMIGGTLYYPLTEKSDQEFQFPNHGLLAHARLTFESKDGKRFHQFNVDGVVFPRRWFPEDGGQVFQIQPERPVDVLMKEALAATPPRHQGEFNSPDLVDLATLDPTIKFDIRYATNDNFLGVPVYPIAKALLQRPAAAALRQAHKSLEKDGFGLLIHDAYRPWHVTKVFWDATPQLHKIFVADPANGSRHNRGCAVDLTLYDLASGQPIIMPGGYDEFSDRSYPLYPGGTSLQRWHRDRLKRAMHEQGFMVYEAEWWHFDFRDWKKYPVLNIPLRAEKK